MTDESNRPSSSPVGDAHGHAPPPPPPAYYPPPAQPSRRGLASVARTVMIVITVGLVGYAAGFYVAIDRKSVV